MEIHVRYDPDEGETLEEAEELASNIEDIIDVDEVVDVYCIPV